MMIRLKSETKNNAGIMSEEKKRKVLTAGVKYSTDSKRAEILIRPESSTKEYPRASAILTRTYLRNTPLNREIIFLYTALFIDTAIVDSLY